jgi:hypothetical protein
MGQLKQATAYTVTITNDGGNTDGLGIDFVVINKADQVAVCDAQTLAKGETKQFPQQFGPKKNRFEIHVFAPPALPNCLINVSVAQGAAALFNQTLAADTVLTWDVVA